MMLFQSHSKQTPLPPAIYPQRHQVRTGLPSEASPTSPFNIPTVLTHTKEFSTSQGHAHMTHLDLSSQREEFKDPSDLNKLQHSSPLLLHLLRSDGCKNSHLHFPAPQSVTERLGTSGKASVSFTMVPPTAIRPRTDDQILELIQKKLNFFRTKMKGLGNSSDGPTPAAFTNDCVPNTPRLLPTLSSETITEQGTCHSKHPLPVSVFTPNDLALDREALVRSVSMDNCTKRCPLAPLRAPVCCVDHVETPGQELYVDTVVQTFRSGNVDNLHVFTSTEYVGIMREAGAVCSRRGDEECPAVVQDSLSGQEYLSTWRNMDQRSVSVDSELKTVRNIMKHGNNSHRNTVSSAPSSSSPTSLAFPLHLTSQESLAHSSTDNKDMGKCFRPDFAQESSSSAGNVQTDQRRHKITNQTKEQTSAGKSGGDLLDPKYDNITDDEQVLHGANTNTQNIATPADPPTDQLVRNPLKTTASQKVGANVPMLLSSENCSAAIVLEDISDSDGVQEDTPEPQEKSSASNMNTKQVQRFKKPPLVCTCPCMVQVGDEFEERPCPKCVHDALFQRQEENGVDAIIDLLSEEEEEEEEDDEWHVFPIEAIDVTLEQPEHVHLEKDKREETEYVEVKLVEFNNTVEWLKALSNYSAEDKAKMLSQLPRASYSDSAFPPEPDRQAENSCDTEDSCDYPSFSRRNHLSVPSGVSKPHRSASSGEEEEEENAQPIASTSKSKPSLEAASNINYFPELTDDDEDEAVKAAVTKPSPKELSPGLAHTKPQKVKKSVKKKRLQVIESEDKDQPVPLKRKKKPSESNKALSAQPQSQKPRPGQKSPKFFLGSTKASSSVHQKQATEPKSPTATMTSQITKTRGQKRPSPNVAQEQPDKPSILSSNGEQFQARPGPQHQSIPSIPQTPSISTQNPLNSDRSQEFTTAKKKVTAQWRRGYIPTSTEKKQSAVSLGPPHTNAGHRRTSNEGALSKKTKDEAKQWTKRVHRKPSTELNSSNTLNNYKWKEKATVHDVDWERERDSPERPRGLKEY